ncbi:MAG: copper resistance protein CopC [Thermomicrobiales bacterium]|nr:copper resistance protein CopC [Thermomicrobiales bacterium]MCO5220562.1 copper resistance protein CopC [Thermomicrobiales bacterium]
MKSVKSLSIALLLLGFLMSPAVTLGHAGLDRSQPEADATVEEAPVIVELWFTQEIAKGSGVDVLDASGNPVHTGEAEIDLMDPDRKHLTIALESNLPNGVYTVNWTTLSAEDGDEETGTFTFTIAGSGTPVASPVASPAASPIARISGGLIQEVPEAEPADMDERALGIAVGAGILAALLIYGFWRLVRPRRHPFDRNPD